ncbi:uncharacterized protein TNCV_4325311 [Trichonephila clavipes]|nr:uncharacterized protein TNCV_4325311 [Trichonephila clavipes]
MDSQMRRLPAESVFMKPSVQGHLPQDGQVESSRTSATRGLLATDLVISNNGQVTKTTPELAIPLLTTPTHQWEDVGALDRFNVHRSPSRWFFSGTGL